MKTALVITRKSLRLLAQTSTLLALLLTFASMARADALSYNVSITGSNVIDLQFNPGQLPGTQLAYAEATVPTCCNIDGVTLIGDTSDDAVAGPPSFISFDNQSALNEAIIQLEVEPDTVLSFSFSISGPAVDTPDGTSHSGTTFSIGPGDSTSNPDGILGLVNLNLNGTGTVQTFSSAISITDLNPSPPVPEPSTLILLTTGLTGTIAFIRRKSSRARRPPRVTNISL
jgi:hypothetical protein